MMIMLPSITTLDKGWMLTMYEDLIRHHTVTFGHAVIYPARYLGPENLVSANPCHVPTLSSLSS